MFKKVIFLSIVLFSIIACGDDSSSKSVLNYDADNFDAPSLFPGEYTTTVRFPSNQMTEYTGRQMDEIEFWITDLPVGCEIVVYGEGTETTPGALLHSETVSLKIDANSWNRLNLSSAVDISGEDLWVGLKFSVDELSKVVGCDAGPAKENGDLMNDENSNWTTLRAYSNGDVDINWNIRAYIAQ